MLCTYVHHQVFIMLQAGLSQFSASLGRVQELIRCIRFVRRGNRLQGHTRTIKGLRVKGRNAFLKRMVGVGMDLAVFMLCVQVP